MLEWNSDHLIFDSRPPRRHDSLLFQELAIDRENVITSTISTDGAVVFKSTKERSLWPLQFIVNEIDLEHRFRRYNMFCSAISFGATPNMQILQNT